MTDGAKPTNTFQKWLSARVSVPALWLLICTLVGIFNVIIFLSLVATYWKPDVVPVPITGDVVLGLHLQLFEAFLAALAIGLAVFGFIGYAALRESAERRAEDTAREFVQRYTQAATKTTPPARQDEPDLSGLDTDVKPGDREPEDKGL